MTGAWRSLTVLSERVLYLLYVTTVYSCSADCCSESVSQVVKSLSEFSSGGMSEAVMSFAGSGFGRVSDCLLLVCVLESCV